MRIYIYKKCMTAGWYSLRALFNPISCLFPPHVEIQERGHCLWNRSLATGLQQVGGLLPRFFCCRTVTEPQGRSKTNAWLDPVYLWSLDICLFGSFTFVYPVIPILSSFFMLSSMVYALLALCATGFLSFAAGYICDVQYGRYLERRTKRIARASACSARLKLKVMQWLGMGRNISIRNRDFYLVKTSTR